MGEEKQKIVFCVLKYETSVLFLYVEIQSKHLSYCLKCFALLLVTSLEQIDCPKMFDSQRPSKIPTRRSTTFVKHTQKGANRKKTKNILSQNDDINVDNSCDESNDSFSLLILHVRVGKKHYPRQKMAFVVIFASTDSA